jgi:hypothetical protein
MDRPPFPTAYLVVDTHVTFICKLPATTGAADGRSRRVRRVRRGSYGAWEERASAGGQMPSAFHESHSPALASRDVFLRSSSVTSSERRMHAA